MDGLHTFASLCTGLPYWNERLDTLAKQVYDRHAEFVRLSRSSAAGAGAASVSAGSIRRRRTGSTESLRPKDGGIGVGGRQDDVHAHRHSITLPLPPSSPTYAPIPHPIRVEINPDHRRVFYDLRMQSKRKRLPNANSLASGVSGAGGAQPSQQRSRLSLIVYYDSAIQENFEWLVRSIAGARNTVRKGRTAESLNARIASMNRDNDKAPYPAHLRTDSLYSSASPSTPYSSEPFDRIDRELEVAQSLCEVGAHRFLRDGACRDELAGTKERFLAVLRIADGQRVVYEEQAARERERERERESERAAERRRQREVERERERERQRRHRASMDTTDTDTNTVDTNTDGNADDDNSGRNSSEGTLTPDSSPDDDLCCELVIAKECDDTNPVDVAIDLDPTMVGVDPYSHMNSHSHPLLDLSFANKYRQHHNHQRKHNHLTNNNQDVDMNNVVMSMGTIEIDDSADENECASFHVDISAFRQTRRC